jgi:hypothetical protein
MADFDINNEPTVFVLGAGASNPYEFPLSDQLKSIILSDRSMSIDNRILTQCLTEQGYNETKIKLFKEALQYGDYGNIDLFLERKTSFRVLGAYFIAHAVAKKENHESLFTHHDWYTILYNLLSLESDSDEIPPLNIVTLNYDRSVEHFLSRYLDYNCPDQFVDSGKRKLTKMRIVHAHGSIGRYDTVPYGNAGKDASSLHEAAGSIRIVSDSMESSLDFQEAEKLIGSARNVVFIGLGYNKITLERLLRRTQIDQVRLFGTGFQLGENTQSELKEMFQGKMKLGDDIIETVGFLQQLGLNVKSRSK